MSRKLGELTKEDSFRSWVGIASSGGGGIRTHEEASAPYGISSAAH